MASRRSSGDGVSSSSSLLPVRVLLQQQQLHPSVVMSSTDGGGTIITTPKTTTRMAATSSNNSSRASHWTTATTTTTTTTTWCVLFAAAAAAAMVVVVVVGYPTMAEAAVVSTTILGPAVTTTTTTAVPSSTSWYASLVATGFYQAFSLVFLSELGDKTFFIAGLLAMKTSRIISLIGSLSALIVMTILSVVIGQIFHVLPSFGGGIADGVPLDDIAAAMAFAFFGIKILKEAFEMDDSTFGGSGSDGGSGKGTSAMGEELAEAEEAVKENQSKVVGNQNKLGQIASIFTLVFAAEFGDRSFLSTIALSAAQNPVSVAGGAIAAHAVATGIAVAGGSVVAKYLSEKVISFIGGTLFLIFAVTTVLGIF
jgi:putative Ca2+/H+ antiporter (TMEM165/GDT1 family)